MGGYWKREDGSRFGGNFDRYKSKCMPDRWNMGEEVHKKIIAWDTAPGKEYFEELFRVSRNQIIWGGNYFELPPTRCFVIWKKLTISENFTMAMAEYAWTSFNDNAKVFEYAPQAKKGDIRFHPTQKPVELYEWLLNRYAKDGDIILDTHVGSASSLIACRNTNHKYVGFEIDQEYYSQAKKRLDQASAQMNIFDLLNSER
jgi:site-specific DNA-methyltransferase (adenine-specific)